MNSYVIPVTIVLAGVLIAGAVFVSRDARDATVRGTAEQGQTQQGQVSIDLDGWPSLGDPDAPVVMVEYSDFACSFCGRFWRNTLPDIKEEFVDTGVVRFVYKDFAIVGGDRAAEAAHCAAEQDAFWEYHDLLFERASQDRGRWANASVHRGYAEALGLDADALVSCFGERRYQQRVAQSTQEALDNGGRGTPFFLINERAVSGAQPLSAFRSVINLAQ